MRCVRAAIVCVGAGVSVCAVCAAHFLNATRRCSLSPSHTNRDVRARSKVEGAEAITTKWWEKGPSNMVSVNGVQELVDALVRLFFLPLV